MVFWNDTQSSSSIKEQFTSEIIEKDALESPTGFIATCITYNTITPELKIEICAFLRTYFGDPPHTPILDIPEDRLLDTCDYLLLVRDSSGYIAGSIRYRHTGELLMNKRPTIYRVDAFCIRPDWRKKGVADYLLTELQRYATKNGQPYAMFLKEGPQLSMTHFSYYSGTYVYRKLDATYTPQPHVRLFSSVQAYHMLDLYHSIYPNLFIIRNQHQGQQWRYYKNGFHTILACFQDTHQRMPKTNEKIGWCTAWLESSVVTDEIRKEAAMEITNTLPFFDYVWMNKKWVGNHIGWKQDGGFHWYTYQWSTNLEADVSMCILD